MAGRAFAGSRSSRCSTRSSRWGGPTVRIDAELIGAAAAGAMTAYICGSNGFVEAASGLLSMGMTAEVIRTERFGLLTHGVIELAGDHHLRSQIASAARLRASQNRKNGPASSQTRPGSATSRTLRSPGPAGRSGHRPVRS